jgi:hypothetical protein
MGVNTLPTKVVTKFPDFNLKGKKIKEAFEKALKDAHQESSLKATEILKDAIRFKSASATGTLINSVYRRLLQNKAGQFTSNIGFQKPASEYAFFANFGRHSGKKPPFDAIAKWASAKKGITDVAFIWYLVNRIGEEGTEGTHFMEYAEPRIEKNTAEILAKKLDEFKRNLKNA